MLEQEKQTPGQICLRNSGLNQSFFTIGYLSTQAFPKPISLHNSLFTKNQETSGSKGPFRKCSFK